MPPFHIKNITLATFKNVLSRYPATVPEKLRDLDTARYDTIPAAVAARSPKYLTKDEVVKLVEWKLKHGTFRPALLNLVQSNSPSAIEETTRKASAALSGSSTKVEGSDPLPALKILVGLKGVGPATASLLLSVLEPGEVPFFSDEVFRWCCWDEGKEGWQRKIKYNVKEYEMVVKRVGELRRRLGEGEVEAVQVEKVAWVLGKEGVDVGGEEVDEELFKAKNDGEDAEKKEVKEGDQEQTNVEEAMQKSVAKKGTKRKATEAKTPAEGTRKSTRTKK